MLDALNTLLENNVISESVRQEIQEAWEQKVKENRLEVTATLRLQKTNELFFNKILDEKILVLHEAIQSKRKGEKV